MPSIPESRLAQGADEPRVPEQLDNKVRAAELVSMLLGAWLAASSFFWPQGEVSRNNTLVVGLVMAAVAAAVGVAPVIRRFNSMLAVWLAFSALAIFQLRGVTLWNNLAVAVAVFALSLVGQRSIAGGSRRYARA